MAYDPELAARIREVLEDESDLREVKMFGALAFMVDGEMAVTANSGGELMVRVSRERGNQLLLRPGASEATMGGNPMGKGWIVVAASGVASDADLRAWVGEALARR